MMKKFRVSSFFIAMVCVLGLFSGCADDTPKTSDQQPSGGQEHSDVATSDAVSGDTSDITYTPSQSRYLAFMRDLSDSDTINPLNSSYCFKDLDGDGEEDLLLKEATKLTIYTLNGEEVSEIGQNEFYTGTLRLLNSGDPAYPGIICFTVGGGREWYQYLSVKDGNLSLENLWTYNYAVPDDIASELGETTEYSTDKKLIELSKTAYEKEQDVEFISLEMFYFT